MNRLTRGFHRIGLVGAIPALLASVAFILAEFLGLGGNGELGMAVVFLVLGTGWYVLCRTAAWIINGFREPA